MMEIAEYINKTVDSQFAGQRLKFDLSQGLFSSHSVDSGTRLLMKTLAQSLDLDGTNTVLDVGCGVGIIGVSLAKRSPAARVVLQDRDALAVEFARYNGERNGLTDLAVQGSLALEGDFGSPIDLIVSNLPAKAGAPVLRAFLRTAPLLLTENGVVAVVVVTPLAEAVRETLSAEGMEILLEEATKGHRVFHYRGGRAAIGREPDSPVIGLAPYIRARSSFSFRSVRYTIDVAYNIPDFDTLGTGVALAFETYESAKPRPGRAPAPPAAAQTSLRRIACWNPGQGHLPVYLTHRLRGGAVPVEILLCGRDLLQLEISRHNLIGTGAAVSKGLHLASEELLKESIEPRSLDLLTCSPMPIPGVSWQGRILSTAGQLLRDGGTLLVWSTSTEMARLMQVASGGHREFVVRAGKKRNGYRAVALQKVRKSSAD